MLFCLTAEYTPQALNAMRENPNTDRRAAVEQLLEAAGGKLVAMYGRASNGPGAMVIFDVPDPAMAPAMCGVARISRFSTERRADAPLHDGRDRRHSAKGEADPRRLQAARSAVISLGAAAV